MYIPSVVEWQPPKRKLKRIISELNQISSGQGLLDERHL